MFTGIFCLLLSLYIVLVWDLVLAVNNLVRLFFVSVNIK
jgi:hypothetical protein